MNETVETIKYRDCLIKIYQDENPESPREWSNLGIIAYKHRRYTLGEEKINDPIDWLTKKLNRRKVEAYNDDVKNKLEALFLTRFVAFPLYLYDHSGITISTSPFSCRWDSGQIGYIYTTKEKILEAFGGKRVSAKMRKRAKGILLNEINTFDQCLRGDVYGFVAETKDGDHIDSCWGYFGNDWDYMIKEAEESIDYHIGEQAKKRAEQVKGYIKNHVPLIHREAFAI